MADHVQRSIDSTAQGIMGSGRYTPESPPDPLALFQLENVVDAGANVYAFQKAFAGSGMSQGSRWGFDVIYEPLETGQEPENTQHCELPSLVQS